MLRAMFFIGLMLGAIGLTGCAAWKREALQKQIGELTTQRQAAEEKAAARNRNLTALQAQATDLTRRISTRQNGITSYLKNHKFALSCMAAVGYSIGADNIFSDDVNGAIAGYGVFCGTMYLLDDNFTSEVQAVVNEINQADKDVKNFQAQVKALQPEIEGEQRTLATHQAEVSRLKTEIQKLQTELHSLQ